jgi:ubiquinol-cytochrome c reductase cytochrome b subunit
MMLAFAGLHIWMVVGLGINEWPMPGRVVRRSTYVQEYDELTHKDGIPFVPGAVWKDMIFAAAIMFAVALCAVLLGPFGPTGFPDPTIIQTVPKPDFFFLWLYTILSFLPENLETPFILIAPAVGILFLLALPVLSITVLAVGFAVCQQLGTYTPWSPQMQAWSGDTVPVRYVHTATPLGRQGQIVFQEKQCRNCHMLGGQGGERGPALDAVATRLTYDQLVRQVLQGGGNMPAYGKNLSPAEVTALVSFLETLHPEGQLPAQDASQRYINTGELEPAH